MQYKAHRLPFLLELPHQLPRLLRHPGCRWLHGTASEMNPSRADLDEEEHIQCFQAQGFHREEITRQQLVLVLAREGTPGAALPGTQRCGRDMLAFEHVSNGGAPNTIAQFAQFALDFAIAPTRILSGQAHDQRFEFRRDTWPARSWLMSKGPLVAHEIPMPPQHGFRREQEQALAEPSSRVLGPLDQFASQHGQRQFLPPGETRRTGSIPLQDTYLLAQQQDF